MFIPKAAAAAAVLVALVAAMSFPGASQANVGNPCKHATLEGLLVTSDTDEQCETAWFASLETVAPTSAAVGAVTSADTNQITGVATDPEAAAPEADDTVAFDLANESTPPMANVDSVLAAAAWGCRWYTSQTIEQMSYGLVRAGYRFHVDGDCRRLVGYKVQIQRDSWRGWMTVHETSYQALRGGHWTESLLGCKVGTYNWRGQIVIRKATFDGYHWYWAYEHYQGPTGRYRCNRDYVPVSTPITD